MECSQARHATEELLKAQEAGLTNLVAGKLKANEELARAAAERLRDQLANDTSAAAARARQKLDDAVDGMLTAKEAEHRLKSAIEGGRKAGQALSDGASKHAMGIP